MLSPSFRSCLALLCLSLPVVVGPRCEPPEIHFRSVELGSGLTLWLWTGQQELLPDGRREVSVGAKLLARGRRSEVIVLAASQDASTVVLDAALRFRARHGSPPGPPERDTLRLRLAEGQFLDLGVLAFTALDRYGGALDVATAASGRFRVEEIDGRHWLVTPEGHGFFSAGVSHTTFGGDYSPPIGRSPYHDNALALYGDEETWAGVVDARLRAWGFNTLGAWSPPEHFAESLPHTPVLSLNRAAPEVPGWPTGQTGHPIRDYFDPRFDAALAGRVEEARPCAENPFCIGVFTDNELPWGESVIQRGTYVDAYLTLPPGAPGKLELQTFFEERYGDLAAFNAAWSLDLASFDEIQQLTEVESDDGFCNVDGRRADRQAFVARAAARYFERVHAALRGAFPELLILGTRFLGVYTAPAIVAAAGPWVDVVSVNDYDWDAEGRGLFKSEGEPLGYLFLDDPVTDLETVHEISGKPVMVTEWTFRTPTPDVPVLFPPFLPTVDTQEERADRYQAFMQELLARPYVVGSHWFKYHDQPATGRGDGENSRFGIVNIEDTPYPELTERMTAVNAGITSARLAAPDPVGSAKAAEASVPLGERVFSVTQPEDERTGFFVYILPGVNLANQVVGGPLRLLAGAPDADGVAPLALAEDALLAFNTVVNDIGCLRLQAAGSSGELACDGGFGHDVRVSQAAGPGAPPPLLETFLGADSGPGAATLLAWLEFTRLAAGHTPEDCATAAYPPPVLAALSSAAVTSSKGATSFETVGENFVCGPDGVSWRREDGAGMLVIGVPTRDSRVPGGDLATSFRLADTEETCRP